VRASERANKRALVLSSSDDDNDDEDDDVDDDDDSGGDGGGLEDGAATGATGRRSSRCTTRDVVAREDRALHGIIVDEGDARIAKTRWETSSMQPAAKLAEFYALTPTTTSRFLADTSVHASQDLSLVEGLCEFRGTYFQKTSLLAFLHTFNFIGKRFSH